MTAGNEPVHPCEKFDEHGFLKDHSGLTKREYFAAAMMAALVQAGNYSESPDGLAKGALLRADALIDALNKVPK